MRSRRRQKRRKRLTFGIIRLFLLIVIFVFILRGVKTVSGRLFNYLGGIRDYIGGDYLGDSPEDDYIEEGETQEVLKSMVKKDKRIRKILENYYDYPEILLEMLSRNIEMTDFVLDYSSKKGKAYADTIGKTKKGELPLLLQYDQRWGYANYGEDILAVTGCGPTSLSMVIAKLTGSNKITPYEVAKYAEDNGYYANGAGTSWTLFTEGSKNFGIEGKELPLSKNLIYKTLEAGDPIICSVRPGDFTTTGHIIVLREIKDGKILVYDPNSRVRSKKLWDYETLEGQISNLWVFEQIDK